MAGRRDGLGFAGSLWRDEEAAKLSALDRLVYRSNALGADLTLTNTGGGNTSSKLVEKDPLTAQDVEVLWIKGSGGDLRTARRDGFASLYLDKVRAMKALYLGRSGHGPKTPVEDAMYPLYAHCVFGLNPRACSIDTPLHTFVPRRHVDHLHPNAVIAVAACVNQERLCREIYGDEVLYLPWQRPGFDIGLLIEKRIRESPGARGALLGHHGMSSWDDDDKACYETALGIVDRAARYIEARDRGEKTFGGRKHPRLPEAQRRRLQAHVLPWLRGRLSSPRRVVGTVQDDEKMLRFVDSHDGPRLAALGTSCPDHFLRTKIRPLYAEWDPARGDVDALKAALDTGLERYRGDYQAYYERCRRADSPPMRDPSPTVVLVPGLGMFAWGRTKSESRVTAEFYNCAIEVMRGAEAIDRYEAMEEREAFDIEYWPLEEAKLRRMPPEKELDRQVVAVVGAGAGIGKATVHRLAAEGAHVACVDRDEAAARATAEEVIAVQGPGIGVGGTGLSGCGPAIALGCDITSREAVARMLEEVLLAYGGLDAVVVTAGVFAAPDASGRADDGEWALSFGVNVTGAYIVADEAHAVFRRQGLASSIVLTTSANAVVAKKGSLAYDTSKAAANHLVRELAVEMAPLVRVNAVAPATVIKGSTMFPRDRVIASLKKYEIAFDAAASDEDLRSVLAEFYARRTLTHQPIDPQDCAAAILFLAGPQSRCTTGHLIPVDGGLTEAFLR